MRFAVLTDIHGNREAFQAVLDDAWAHGAERFALLGDFVGYGPDPEWCCDMAERLVADGAIAVKGNHDSAASGRMEAMSALAAQAMDWTRGRLSAAQCGFLADLPMTERDGDTLFVHASADRPEEWSYVTSPRRAAPSFHADAARMILCGHTHVPLLVHQDRTGATQEQSFRPNLAVPLLQGRRWLAVIGSAGQPRDGVAKAGWAIMDTVRAELTYKRTSYDCAVTAEKIRAAGLPETLAARLVTAR